MFHVVWFSTFVLYTLEKKAAKMYTSYIYIYMYVILLRHGITTLTHLFPLLITAPHSGHSKSQGSPVVHVLLVSRCFVLNVQTYTSIFTDQSTVLVCSMTELEKDIGNLRSGLKSVENVSQRSCCTVM